MSKTITLSDKNFEVEVLKSDLPILVDFWAPWCGPCKMMSPVLDDLSEQFDGKMKIGKLDVENMDHAELAGKYNIQSIPNMKLFKGGQIIKEFIGYKEKESFAAELNEILK
ncbi:MAG: Thioredoxin [Parcubacteria group bacterium GW2011_GWE2_39_37]|nr:MAG: Thioredoxin [Parcubacteria group bacterium GW2011_GWE2_39_37]